MTSSENSLVLCLIKENFGETAQSIASLLITKKSYPLPLIASDLNLDKKTVSQCLSALAIHNLVEYKLNSKQLIEYKVASKNVLNMLKYPLYVRQADELVPQFGGMIVHEMLVNGYVEMSSVLLKVLARWASENGEKESLVGDVKKLDSTWAKLRESFEKLTEDEYIERLPRLDSSGGKTVFNEDDVSTESKQPPKAKLERIPKFVSADEERLIVPKIRIDDSRLIKAIEENSETIAVKMRKLNENFGDNEIYWRVNESRFMQQFRDSALIDAMQNRIDNNAAGILRAILKISDSRIPEKAISTTVQSKTVTLIDIQKELRNDLKMESSQIDKYLSVILFDSFKVLEKVGDFGGGAYSIDFKKALYSLCLAHIESYIREKHGSKSLRIFRVILEKSQLEQKQIEDFSMIPSKDCKALLYTMLNDGLLTITELSKTSDHAPSRTFYLFTIDVYQVCKKLLENAYKGMKNLMIRRDFLGGENKRLLEKNKKINAIIDSLKAQGAEQTEIDDVRAMMSSEELKLLNSVNDHCKKIELAEIQLTESIFILESYFYYHTIAPVIPVGRGAK